MCLEGRVDSFISPSTRSSYGPVKPTCAQSWPETPFISFQLIENYVIYEIQVQKYISVPIFETHLRRITVGLVMINHNI